MMRNVKLFRKVFALITCFSLFVTFVLPVNAVEVEPVIGKADIIVMIDKSFSMVQEMPPTVHETKDFVNKLISEDVDCRLGIATFASHAGFSSGNWTGFANMYGETNIPGRIDTMLGTLGASYSSLEQTSKAIKIAAGVLNSEARVGAGRILIIVTDDPVETQNAAAYSRENVADTLAQYKINTFFIGEEVTPVNNDKSFLDILQGVMNDTASIRTQLNDIWFGNGTTDLLKLLNPNKVKQKVADTRALLFTIENESENLQLLKANIFRLQNGGSLSVEFSPLRLTVTGGTLYDETYDQILEHLQEQSLPLGVLYDIDGEEGSRYLLSGALAKGIGPAYMQILSLLLLQYTQTLPVIDSFSVPASLKPTDTVHITALVHDLDIDATGTGDTLAYALKMQKPDGSTEDIALAAEDITIAVSPAEFNGSQTIQYKVEKTLPCLTIGTYKAILTVNDLIGARAEAESTIIVSNVLPPIDEMTDRVTAANKELTPQQIADGLNKYLPGSNVITKVKFTCNGAGNYTIKFEPNAPNGVTIPNLQVIQDSTNADVADSPVTFTDTYSVGTQADGNEITLHIQYKFNKNTPTTPLSSTQLLNKVTVIKDGTPIQDKINIIEIRDANIIKQ